MTWPRLPHAMQDLTPETVVTEQDLVPAQVERLSTPEDLVPSKLWSDEISSRQAALIEQRAPLLSGRGVRDGHECHVEICLAGGDVCGAGTAAASAGLVGMARPRGPCGRGVDAALRGSAVRSDPR